MRARLLPLLHEAVLLRNIVTYRGSIEARRTLERRPQSCSFSLSCQPAPEGQQGPVV